MSMARLLVFATLTTGCFSHRIEKQLSMSLTAEGATKDCSVQDWDRADCGFFGVDQGSCEGKGCCWAESHSGAPWCFYGAQPDTGGEQCTKLDHDKKECGWMGITKQGCESEGCCWAKSNSGAPWCFQSHGGPSVHPPVQPPVVNPIQPKFPPHSPTPSSSEVYVMLSLTTVTNDGNIGNKGHLAWELDKLKEANTDGFMVDVWWGLTEPQPKAYNFGAYQELVQMAEERALKVQFVTSFHQCGGNVGDDCFIPLPSFVADQNDIWFKDENGAETKEYISFFADNVVLDSGRTALDMYADWFSALASAFESKLGNTITEIQVGLGPCGELRYPAYPLSRWSFCGVGEFQCWDKHALANLSAIGQSRGWTSPPTHKYVGSYNSRPWDTNFFTVGYKSDYGKFFLDWYFGSMKSHAAQVLQKANLVFGGKVALASKVAGIHWWYGHESHASEVTAGYYNANSRDAYAEIADVFAANGAALDFTCLEMRNSEQSSECKSQPEDLVNQVRNAAAQKQIHFNGENALPRYDWTAYEQILKYKQALFAFTYLRLTDKLLGDGYDAFKSFVGKMHQS